MPRVLGVDPGFANIGIVGMEFSASIDDARIVYSTLVRTDKSDKKLRLRKNSDDQRRHGLCFDAYMKALDQVKPLVVSLEGVSFVRNAATMCNIGGSWYGLFYLLRSRKIYTVDYTPQELKLVATGRKSAAKKDMIDAVNRRWPSQIGWDSCPASKHEHVADAAVAAWAAIIDSNIPWSVFNSSTAGCRPAKQTSTRG